jgi:hypothetical protein
MRSVTTPLSNIKAVVMKSSLASNRENWVLLMSSSFLRVDFKAPVMPELHWEPNPIAVTRTIESSFHRNGTSCFACCPL